MAAFNKTSQATAVFAFLLVLSWVPAAPEFFRYANHYYGKLAKQLADSRTSCQAARRRADAFVPYRKSVARRE
jgi:hypothetical protein